MTKETTGADFKSDAEHIGGVLIIEPGKVRGVIPHIWYRLIRIIQPLCGGG